MMFLWVLNWVNVIRKVTWKEKINWWKDNHNYWYNDIFSFSLSVIDKYIRDIDFSVANVSFGFFSGGAIRSIKI